MPKASAGGVFENAADSIEPGNSIFILTSDNGTDGTFVVIDNSDVHKYALMMPTETLVKACSGNSLQLSQGFSRIVTDCPGKAHLEAGLWHISQKAAIHYEK